MSVMPVMPRDHDWTVDDLDQIPDDGLQYELLDGMLLVNPGPVRGHQWAQGQLFAALHNACPPHLEVYPALTDWRPDNRTSLQPDILVVRADDPGRKNFTGGLLLAVEVPSPSTRRKDQVYKRSKYEDAGVESYWIVDADLGKPSILVCELRDGRYVETATVYGDEELQVEAPFPFAIRPSALARY